MFISVFTINPANAQVRSCLSNFYGFHQMLLQGFEYTGSPTARADNDMLFRLLTVKVEDIFDTKTVTKLFVASKTKPNWDFIDATGFKLQNEPKDMTATIESFTEGNLYGFNLQAYPARRTLRAENDTMSRRLLLRTLAERMEWLNQQGEQHGFEVLNAREETAIGGTVKSDKNENTFNVYGKCFVGVLRVTDAEKFAQAFQKGIGHCKNYGMGLLMLSNYAK